MTISATTTISEIIGNTSIENGGDALAILRTLQGFRYSIMADVLGNTANATSGELLRAMQVSEYANLPTRLQSMPDTPDGKGKILATFSAGADELRRDQIPDSTVMSDLNEMASLGIKPLPMEKWVYAYETPEAPAGPSGHPVLTSPLDMAKIQADYQFAQTKDGVDYYARKTGSGADEKTSYMAVYRNEGAYCAQDSDIAKLVPRLEDHVDQATNLLTDHINRLGGVSRTLLQDVLQDQPWMRQVRHEQKAHDERHIQTLLALLQEAPVEASNVQEG